MTAEARARFPLGLTIATLIALAILIGLGTWQMQRLAWKQALLARIEALKVAPAVPAAPVLARMAAGDDTDFVRVTLDCPGLARAAGLNLYAVRDGDAGQRLVSACPLAGGPYRTLLVDRGFIAQETVARPTGDPADRSVSRVTGVLRAPEPPGRFTPPNDPAGNRWYSRDHAAMARALGAAAPAPLVLMAETATNPEFPALVPAPIPAEISNRHLEYALTWYGLAAALVGVYAAVLWRKWKN